MKLEVKHLPDRLLNKLQYFKKQYASGLLTNEQINSLKKENLIHLFYSPEQLSNENTKKVCEFYKTNSRLPSKYSKDEQEKKLGIFLRTRREAKKGLGKSKFYESDQKIAESYGLLHIFEEIDPEKVSNENTKKVCEFYKINNRLPSITSKNEEEKKLGNFLHTRRQAKKGLRKYKFYESDQKIAESYGLLHIFEEIGLEKVSNENTKKVCEFYKINNRFPSRSAKNEEENKLGIFIVIRRQAKKGVGNHKFYESDQKIAESYGLPHIFEEIDPEKVSNENTIKVCDFYKINNRLPSKHAKNEKEKKLAKFIDTRRQAKKGVGRSKFYESDQKIAESYGLPHLFDTKDKA